MSTFKAGDIVEVLPSNGLRFREGPDLRMPIMQVLGKGEQLIVLELPYTPPDTRYDWLYLEHGTGRQGWSAAKSNITGNGYLKKIEDISPPVIEEWPPFVIEEWPTEFIEHSNNGTPITQYQNARPSVYARFGLTKGHNGVDLHAPLDSKIYAVYPGVISRIGYSRNGYGRNVRVEHGPYTVIYAHLRMQVPGEIWDRIEAGDVIGYSGNTGFSDGPHLHIELRDSRALIPVSPYYEGEVWGVVDIENYITDYLSSH